jgi:diadenylate cyclase
VSVERAAALVAPGKPLREALDAVVAARLGALLVVGAEDEVSSLASGGFSVHAPFTPQSLYELCKMDGAVTLDAGCATILRANVHLVPDATLPSAETGIRHRTAEQLARATSALVIAVSQRRDTITLYLGGERLVLPAAAR